MGLRVALKFRLIIKDQWFLAHSTDEVYEKLIWKIELDPLLSMFYLKLKMHKQKFLKIISTTDIYQ